MPSGFVAAECMASCGKADQLQNVPVEHFDHGMEWFGNIGEILYGMNEDGWWDMICMKWMMKWNGFSLWNGVKEHKNYTAIHDMFYSLTARHQILYFDMKMRWMEDGMRWMICGMEYNMNELMRWSMDG